MSLWGTFTLKQENAKELKLDDLKEPSEEDFVYIYCCLCFGGICNNDELKEISEIVYKAYLREKRKKENSMYKIKRFEDRPEVKELINKNIGKNKWKWLEKQGIQLKEDYEMGSKDYTIWTKDAEYIGLLGLNKRHQHTINFIYRHRLTQLSSIAMATKGKLDTHSCNPVSIGFNEQEQAWYGWTHRGYGKFYVGYEIKEGSIMDCGKHKYPFKVETLEQAKQLAIDIAEFLD